MRAFKPPLPGSQVNGGLNRLKQRIAPFLAALPRHPRGRERGTKQIAEILKRRIGLCGLAEPRNHLTAQRVAMKQHMRGALQHIPPRVKIIARRGQSLENLIQFSLCQKCSPTKDSPV